MAKRVCAAIGLALALTGQTQAQAPTQGRPYAWIQSFDLADAMAARIPPPDGFSRVSVKAGSFGDWLRGLPLKKGKPPVHLFDGTLKRNQTTHWAVLDIDVGKSDLQQRADAVIRLRAEYLFAIGEADSVGFRFTTGERAAFSAWAAGERLVVVGKRVSWKRIELPDAGYKSFREYLDTVFTYAGSDSLEKELKPVPKDKEIQPGDVFIQGGFPGHGVLVLDVVRHGRTGQKLLLLAQGFTPAQELHVLRNPVREDSPWYDEPLDGAFDTPEWPFLRADLRRF